MCTTVQNSDLDFLRSDVMWNLTKPWKSISGISTTMWQGQVLPKFCKKSRVHFCSTVHSAVACSDLSNASEKTENLSAPQCVSNNNPKTVKSFTQLLHSFLIWRLVWVDQMPFNNVESTLELDKSALWQCLRNCFEQIWKSDLQFSLLDFSSGSEKSNQKCCVVFPDLLIGVIGRQIKRRIVKRKFWTRPSSVFVKCDEMWSISLENLQIFQQQNIARGTTDPGYWV